MMLKEQTAETILGAIVALAAIGFFAFASTQSGRGETRGGYELTARFQRVDGIAVGSDVRMSGVKVGAVRAMGLDPETYMAKLTFTIDPSVQVLDQSTARVQSNGLLGDAYVSIEPAGLDPLQPGAEIVNTQGAIDLITVLASAMATMGGNAREENSP
jgi:phospholipid/cholesterol/gamma-HCH transport system substrate-binding protein